MQPVHQAGTVAALRNRLYQPDPPLDAVGVYLDAVREAGDDAAVLTPPSGTHHRRPRGGLLAGGLLVCCAALDAGVAVVPPASAWTAGASEEQGARDASGLESPPVTGVPIGVLQGVDGPGAGRFSAGGEHVVVSVNCSGEGTFEVRIGPDDPVTLVCEQRAVAFALVASRTALDEFSVVAAPNGPVRWSLAVGAIDLPTT